MLEEATKRLPPGVIVHNDDVLDLHRFYGAHIDCIYAQGDVISYSLDPYGAMNEFLKIIDVDGIIIVSFDNYWFQLIKCLLSLNIHSMRSIIMHNIVFMDYANKNYVFPSKVVKPSKLNSYMKSFGYNIVIQFGKPSIISIILDILRIRKFKCIFFIEVILSRFSILSRHIEISYAKKVNFI